MTTILDAMSDEQAFAPWFKGASWDPWKAVVSTTPASARFRDSPSNRVAIGR